MNFLIQILLIALSLSLLTINGLVELSNIKCITYDRKFSVYEYCHIRAVNRTYKYISLKLKLLQKPLTNVTVRLDLRKKASGYKPFLYNLTFDACQYLRRRKNPIIKFFHSFIEPYTNMNHTCPYDHDLCIEKWDVVSLNNLVTNVLPLPEGDYGIFTTWYAYNARYSTVDVFFKLS